MNMVGLVGNLATDPETRTSTEGGRTRCTFRLAVSRPGGEQADFFTIVAWERQAEVCQQYLSVGRRIAVEGRLHHSTWTVQREGAEPERRSRVEVIAHRVEMLGSGPRRETSEAEATGAPAVDADFAPAISAAPPEVSLV